MGAVSNAPDVDSREFPPYAAGVIRDLHLSLKKNILVLFTANATLSEVNDCLKADPAVLRKNVLAQNLSGPRSAILEQFGSRAARWFCSAPKVSGRESTFRAKTCEVVIIARLPFPVPTHPLVAAISEKMARLHGESFMSYAVPEAVIRFRQGCGRLIRTATDRGALIVLDNRIITRGYGRQFTKSIGGELLTFANKGAMLDRVKAFFEGGPADDAAPSSITYVPFDEV